MPEAAPVTTTPAPPPKPNGATPGKTQDPVVPAPKTDVKAKVPAGEQTDTYVIDGKQVQLTKTQAVTLIQKAAAADKRFNEVAQQRKQMENLLQALKNDPEAVLRHLGADPDKLFEARLAKKAKFELMSPEQQAIFKMQEERDAMKAQLDAQQKAQLTEKQKAVDARNQQHLEAQLIASAQKYKLDQTPETLELMCDVALEAIGLEMSITPDQIAQEVIRRQQDFVIQRDKKVLSKMTDDGKLLEYLGDELVKRILKASLSKYQSKATLAKNAGAKPKTNDEPVKRPAKGYISEADFNKKWLK